MGLSATGGHPCGKYAERHPAADGPDENGTLARLREHRRQRLGAHAGSHGGRLVMLTGDGADRVLERQNRSPADRTPWSKEVPCMAQKPAMIGLLEADLRPSTRGLLLLWDTCGYGHHGSNAGP